VDGKQHQYKCDVGAARASEQVAMTTCLEAGVGANQGGSRGLKEERKRENREMVSKCDPGSRGIVGDGRVPQGEHAELQALGREMEQERVTIRRGDNESVRGGLRWGQKGGVVSAGCGRVARAEKLGKKLNHK